MTTARDIAQRPDTGAAVLQMIRAELDIKEFHQWSGVRGFDSRGVFDEGFALHCLLVECFGEFAPKPFRAILPRARGRRVGTLYGYARCTASELRRAQSLFCDPKQLKIFPPRQIESKPMPTQWHAGSRLGFEVVVRPTIRRARGSDRAGKECDAFQAEAERHDKGEMRRSREEVYSDWLKVRLEAHSAARLECATLAMFQRTHIVRKLHGRHSEGPDALMRGTLKVSNPLEFKLLLERGLGRHKAYGYGMLLLRPPRG